MDIMIRKIAASDYPAVVGLWNEALGNRNVDIENFSITMHKMNTDGNYKTFVAISENKVVGFVTIIMALSAGLPIGYVHVQGLAVQEDLQNKGIGTKLLSHMENFAKENGISSIILCSGFKRTDAHAFYEHKGYDKDSYCFDKVLNKTK